jgi:hypothetical protein
MVKACFDCSAYLPIPLDEVTELGICLNDEAKAFPVDQYAKQLESNRSGERDAGISSLSAMIALGNPAAFQTLLQYLSSLAPPRTIKEVHLKKEILRQLACWKDRSAVAAVLIQELGRIPSNNTTRQWISDILKFLARCPLEVVQDPLERMLADRKFSFKLMRKVKEALLR